MITAVKWPKAQERMEQTVHDELVRGGHRPFRRLRLHCGLIAHLATGGAVFEVKAYIDRDNFLGAIGHLLICNAELQKPRLYLVIGELAYGQDIEVLRYRAQKVGVQIVRWPAWHYDPRFGRPGECEHCAALLFEAANERGWRP
jgi:hypothetical protein